MPRVPLLLGVLAPAALLGQDGAGAELWRVAATTLAQPPALATGGAAGFWNPAQPATGERAAFGLDVVNTPSSVGASGVLFTARARVSPVGRVGIVYGRMSISDLVPTSLSPDPDGGTIPFYTQTVGASWSATRGASALGATFAYRTTQLDYEHSNRWTLDVGVRYGVTGALTVALATRSFSRFAASDAAQDLSAGIDYRVWRGAPWRGGGAASVHGRYGITLTRGFTQDHQFGAGFALGDLFATDLLVVREGSYSGARWRFVAGLGLVIGRYRLTLAENPGVAGVGASYRVGVEALFR